MQAQGLICRPNQSSTPPSLDLKKPSTEKSGEIAYRINGISVYLRHAFGGVVIFVEEWLCRVGLVDGEKCYAK
jgi:hypothetical protein